jgi:hypothetical protein
VDGTLAGTGTINNAVTVNNGGRIAPGNSVGTLTVSALTLTSGSALTYEFGTSASDFVNVTGNSGLTVNGGAFALYEEGTTNPFTQLGTYELIGYTGDLNGAIANLTVANPASNRGYIFSAANGRILLKIVTPFQAWQQEQFTSQAGDASVSGPLADPNANGFVNLLEYAFKLDPRALTTINRPFIQRDANYVSLTYTKNLAATDVTYTIEQTGDLAASFEAAPVVIEELLPNSPPGTQIIKAKVPHNGVSKLFLELSVDLSGL